MTIQQTWNEIETYISEAGIKLYPAPLGMGDEGAFAHWPNDDWRAFLTFGKGIGVDVVYAVVVKFDDDNAQRLTEALGEDRESEVFQHLDEPSAILVAYVHNGVAHSWSSKAEWRNELERAATIEIAVRRGTRQIDFEEQHAREVALFKRQDEFELRLSEDRRFYAAENQDDALRIAGEIEPEFAWAVGSRGKVIGGTAMIVQKAWKRVREVVRPRIVSEVRDDPERVVSLVRLDPDYAEATTKDDRQRAIRRILTAEIGFKEPGLVNFIDQTARRTNP